MTTRSMAVVLWQQYEYYYYYNIIYNYRWYLLGLVGCAWAAVGIGWICAVAALLPFALFVNYCGSIGSDVWYI